MKDNISKFQKIKVLLAFIRHADNKGFVDFDKTKIAEDLHKAISNPNEIDNLLYDLNESGIISYIEVGEDGFKPIIVSSISNKTHEHLLELVNSTNEESDALERRISEILTFNPKQLSSSISETQHKLKEVNQLVSTNDLLKPMEKPLREIMHHFNSVSMVSSNYEDIYKNIIRPVQEEGRSGVKATVNWAIISILASILIPLVISNFNNIVTFFSG